MKLISWNVNSLRNCEGKFLEFVESEQPDVVMVQELRATENDLSFFLRFIPGYTAVFNPSGRPGYGGTAWYQKEGLSLVDRSVVTGNAILDAEGRTIVGKMGDTHIFNFYTPNGNMNEERLRYKLQFYTEVIGHTKSLREKNCPVIIGGDLNVGHTDLDLYDPEGNRNHSGFLLAERRWLTDLLDLGMVDSFRLFERGGGHYSWWNLRDPKRELNQGWRFDYFLVSKDLEPKIKSSRILRDVFGSDHCPILLEIDL